MKRQGIKRMHQTHHQEKNIHHVNQKAGFSLPSHHRHSEIHLPNDKSAYSNNNSNSLSLKKTSITKLPSPTKVGSPTTRTKTARRLMMLGDHRKRQEKYKK